MVGYRCWAGFLCLDVLLGVFPYLDASSAVTQCWVSLSDVIPYWGVRTDVNQNGSWTDCDSAPNAKSHHHGFHHRRGRRLRRDHRERIVRSKRQGSQPKRQLRQLQISS